MSLDFNTGNIKDREVHFPADRDGKMNDWLHAMIWNMMAIDVTEITEANVDEVWFRTDMWQRLIGAQFQQYDEDRNEAIEALNRVGFEHEVKDDYDTVLNFITLQEQWKPLYFTREHVVHAIGLHTNVGTSTRTQFIKKVTGRFTPAP